MSTPDLDSLSSAHAIVVFGLDGQGKPHASRFKGDERELAAKAAVLMGMHVLQLGDTEAQRELAGSLPVGRVFASGKAFVPFVRRPLYEQLCAAGGVPVAEPPRQPQVKAAAGKGAGSPGPSAALDRPLQWSAIRPGSLVLATMGPCEGWFEAVATEEQGDDLFVLRWLDWPDLDLIVRRRKQLALLPVTDEQPH